MIRLPRGTQDILPGESEKWQYVEATFIDICRRFNYQEIRTPIFEHTELFQRGVGDTTDIVQKEMYTFEDRGNRSLTLRPEGTASVVRAFVQNKLYGLAKQPQKLFYIGPMFRYERPQQGRMRQFVQLGVEALGSKDPAIDAEVIALAMTFYQSLGLHSLKLVINSLGDKDSRENHRQALVEHFNPYREELCSDCQTRLDQNPLRVLDCKKDRDHHAMADAPKILDYYNHTAFEIMSAAEGFGAITTLSGGGRYNGLVEDLDGPETPGIGFALSVERLLMALENEGITLPVNDGLDVYVVSLGDTAKVPAYTLTQQLRKSGLSVDKDYLDRKMKAQFKDADRNEAKFVVVLGDEEVNQKQATVKDMATGEQEMVAFDALVDYIQSKR